MITTTLKRLLTFLLIYTRKTLKERLANIWVSNTYRRTYWVKNWRNNWRPPGGATLDCSEGTTSKNTVNEVLLSSPHIFQADVFPCPITTSEHDVPFCHEYWFHYISKINNQDKNTKTFTLLSIKQFLEYPSLVESLLFITEGYCSKFIKFNNEQVRVLLVFFSMSCYMEKPLSKGQVTGQRSSMWLDNRWSFRKLRQLVLKLEIWYEVYL